MTEIKIVNQDYWTCPICGSDCDIYDWGSENSDGENYYENPLYLCVDCDFEWSVEKVYKIKTINSYADKKYFDLNNIGSHRFIGILKIHGQE